MQINVKKLNEDSRIPTYSHECDAGADLYSAIDFTLPSGGTATIPTGICLEIPKGYVGYINPRSGLAAKYGITVLNAPGTIDAGYTGEIKVILANHTDKDYQILKDDRIAQIVFQAIEYAVFTTVDELDQTERGNGGFGSTGMGSGGIWE